ncbi:MAG: hypothetical protein ACM34K_04295 [Bacillota bacterium]
MDLIRQYIVQCITSAANNLRLNTEKIEVVSLLREHICQAADLESEIASMKKITELSTFAIRLGEIFNYIAKSKVDFIKISEKFKEHSYSLVKDLSSLLEKVTPQSFKQILKSMKDTHVKDLNSGKLDNTDKNTAEEKNKSLKIEEAAKSAQDIQRNREKIERTGDVTISSSVKNGNGKAEDGNTKTREDYLLESEKKSGPLLFENYEEKILTPIKEIDLFLKNIVQNQVSIEQVQRYYKIIKENAELSANIGFDIIAGMHRIFGRGLRLIGEGKLNADKETVSGMRAALIVIVAVVRGKEVDITTYLNKAEEFGKRIQNL